MAEDRIQQRINDDIADLPFFHGCPQKDTISLKHYIDRIDQGCTALNWTGEQAYIYFKNSLKSSAAAWFTVYEADNRRKAKQWEVIKPAFRQAFGDRSDPVIFASKIGNIKLTDYNNKLFDYCAAITNMVDLHAEQFLTVEPTLPDNHGLTDAQIQIVRDNIRDTVETIHDNLRKEYFINGLPQTLINKVASRPNLTTLGEILDFLRREEDIDKRNNDTKTFDAPKTSPSATLNPQQGASIANPIFANQPQGGFYQRGQQRGRGQRGQFRGQRGHGSGQFRQNTGAQNGQSGKTVHCAYCKKPYHKQEVCRTRIARNDPCIDKDGFPFYPNQRQNPTREEEDVTEPVEVVSPLDSPVFVLHD